MTRKQKLLQLTLFILFSGLMFAVPYAWVVPMFGFTVPALPWWVYLIVGNISTLGFAIWVSIIERITEPHEEIFD